MKIIKLILLSAVCFVLSAGCALQNYGNGSGGNQSLSGTPVSVVNWNVQTFFDGKKDGCEYSNFQKSGSWNNEKYTARLERLCQAITQLDADIYILEEIENEEIIYDISNQLSANGHNWNQKKFWNYSVFSKEKGSAIGIGILSRYPLSQVKTHSMDIQIHNNKQPSVRYILEATATIEKDSLIIFANHWKSKSGGEEKTEIWRDWQENILGKRLNDLINENNGYLPPTIICGDFNRDADDFIHNDENTFFRFADFGQTDYAQADNLWLMETNNIPTETGSYYYHEKWERIDNIFFLGDIVVSSFEASDTEPWASSQGIPIGYKIYSGEGWSDHLPIMAKLFLTNKE